MAKSSGNRTARGIAGPPIKPEQGRGPRANRDGRADAEHRQQLDDGLPKLGATRSLTECEWLAPKVLVLDDGEPKATIAIGDAPEPTGQEGYLCGRHIQRRAIYVVGIQLVLVCDSSG